VLFEKTMHEVYNRNIIVLPNTFRFRRKHGVSCETNACNEGKRKAQNDNIFLHH